MSKQALAKVGKPILAFMKLPFTWMFALFTGGGSGQLSRKAKLGVEIFVVAVIVCGLGWLNWQLGLERYLAGPQLLRKVWLGLVALLLYVTARFVRFLFAELPREGGQFSDIAKAVQAGCDAAFHARVNLQDSPLFLVLGADEEVEAAMTSSSFVGDRVVSNDPGLPVHFYGDADAVWMTTPGVSAIAQQHSRLKTSRATAQTRLTVAEKDLATQRLRHLARVVSKLRNPIVPLNGVLLLIPFNWLSDPELAHLADTVKTDMAALQNELGIKCMSVVILHGIEQTVEFQSYIECTPEAARQRRCGCTFPLFAEYSDADSKVLHGWIAEFLRTQVYRFYQNDRQRAANGRLFRLLRMISASEDGFCRIMNNAFAADVDEKFYPSGVYFASLNGSSRTFFDGVAAKLTSDHDECIGWNNKAVSADRRSRRIASMLAAAAVLFLTVDAVIVTRFLFAW